MPYKYNPFTSDLDFFEKDFSLFNEDRTIQTGNLLSRNSITYDFPNGKYIITAVMEIYSNSNTSGYGRVRIDGVTEYEYSLDLSAGVRIPSVTIQIEVNLSGSKTIDLFIGRTLAGTTISCELTSLKIEKSPNWC